MCWCAVKKLLTHSLTQLSQCICCCNRWCWRKFWHVCRLVISLHQWNHSDMNNTVDINSMLYMLCQLAPLSVKFSNLNVHSNICWFESLWIVAETYMALTKYLSIDPCTVLMFLNICWRSFVVKIITSHFYLLYSFFMIIFLSFTLQYIFLIHFYCS